MVDFRSRVDSVLKKSMDTFGEECKFFPKEGGCFVVNGIFDNTYEAIDPDTEQVLSGNQPALGINLNDVSFKLKGSEVELRNVRFKISDVQEDGQGGATLRLQRMNINDKIPFRKAD